MAEITRKRVGEIIRAVFEVLLQHPEGMRAKDVLAKLEHTLTLSEFEKSDYPKHPGIRRFEKTARFATIAPVKAGWMIKNKGRWTLTEDGKAACKNFTDPEELARRASELYRQWKAGQPEDAGEDEETVAASATAALDEAEERAWEEIANYLNNIQPYVFQSLVAALLKAMGYHVSWEAPPGPDKGIDILAHTDPLGATNPRIKVQVKRQASSVDVGGLRSFLAVLGDQDVGIFVCTGGFTSAAESEARTQEKRKITLLDMEKLFDLWVQHYGKLTEPDKRLLPLKPVYYLEGLE
ncbi:MAG: Mrr restriction system protein [Acidobacteriia bacterium]|nr:Mrr restriction system protein [Terriglobia bacterium]